MRLYATALVLALVIMPVGAVCASDAGVDADTDAAVEVAGTTEPAAQPAAPNGVELVRAVPVPVRVPVKIEGDTLPAVQRVVVIALNVLIFPILATVLMLVARRVNRWLGGLFDESQLRMIDKGVTASVGYAEQWAQKRIREGLTYTGPEKLEKALAFGLDFAVSQKWPEWAHDKLEDLIEAKLGEGKKAAPPA